jgi:transmembrane protein TMEM260 (protein O-mannosyltransferase)
MRHARAEHGLIAAACAAALYAATLARSVGAGDSGELILAARTLGIAHPPGYALWLLLARVAAAVPAGPLALRVGAVSALTTAAAVGLFWALARRAGLRTAAAAAATVLFATASIVWSGAVEAEVYGLALLAFLAVSLLALRARSARGTRRDETLFFFAAGLSTVAHQTLLFPAAAWSAWVLARPRDAGPVGARLLRGIGWASLGASVSLVLPIRWSAGPAFAWTDVRGLSGLAGYLLRKPYGGLAQNPFRLDRAVDEAVGMAGLVVGSIGWLGAALAASGWALARRSRRVAAPMLVAALTIPAALMALIAFTPDPEHLAQVAPFLAPVVAAAALLAGRGVERIARAVARAGRGGTVGMSVSRLTRHDATHRLPGVPAFVSGALFLATLALLPGRYASADRSRFTLAERYGADLLAATPPRATLVLEGDNETFLTLIAQRERGLRTDVTLTHRHGWIFGDPEGLRGRPRTEWTAIAHDAELARIRRGERLCYALPPADLVGSGVRFTQRGLLYEAALSGNAGAAPAWTVPRDWPRSSDLLEGHPERYDYVTRKMAVAYSDAAARRLWTEGNTAGALPWFLDAARVGYDFPGARLNAATALAAAARPEEALDELLAACRVAPYDPEPAARLAVFLAAAGRHRDAAHWFERAYRAEPLASIAADAARAWRLAGEPVRAAAWSRRAVPVATSSLPRGAEGGAG